MYRSLCSVPSLMKVKPHPPDQCRLRCCAKSHTAQDTVSFPDTVLGWDTNKFINQNYTKNESTHGISYLESTSCEVQKWKKKRPRTHTVYDRFYIWHLRKLKHVRLKWTRSLFAVCRHKFINETTCDTVSLRAWYHWKEAVCLSCVQGFLRLVMAHRHVLWTLMNYCTDCKVWGVGRLPELLPRCG